MDMTLCQKRLALLWFGISGVVFALMLARVLTHGIPDSGSKAVWGWLLPNIAPTLSLIVAVLVTEGLSPPATPKQANAFLFQLSFGLSAAFLAVLLLVMLLPYPAMVPLIDSSQQIWQTPLQGLATAALGAFFVKSKS